MKPYNDPSLTIHTRIADDLLAVCERVKELEAEVERLKRVKGFKI